MLRPTSNMTVILDLSTFLMGSQLFCVLNSSSSYLAIVLDLPSYLLIFDNGLLRDYYNVLM